MSFLKRLFGGGAPAAALPEPTAEIDGYGVRATPFQEGGQWQLCGVIFREVDGVVKEHRFVRADRFTDRDTAIEMAFDKAKRIIAERGARLFD
ncbi:MAG: HlyU family transcriptional regulator [Siculibacillus sp.]|nr:HlyU family transcriptional regulator [Siculibacillus sp.]